MRIQVKPVTQTCRVSITDAGQESIVLRALVRQAIPMLDRPEQYPSHARRQLAQTLTSALEIGVSTDDTEPCQCEREVPLGPEEYEPGCRCEEVTP